MKANDFGYVRVAAAKPVVAIADPEKNLASMLVLAKQAVEKKVQVICFPELGITGYSCGDYFLQDILLSAAEKAAGEYVEQTKDFQLISIFGMPLKVGDQLFNVAVVCQRGKVLAIIPKTFIPNYKEFYERRHYSSADQLLVSEIEFLGQKVPIGTDIVIKTNIPNFSFGVENCEDMWMPIPPSSHLVAQGATVIFNMSASNDVVGKAEYRRKLVENQSGRCVCSYVYASCGFGESTSDVVWSSHLIIADNGNIVAESHDLFAGDQLLMADVDVQRLSRERRLSGSFSQAIAAEKRYNHAYRQIQTDLTALDLHKIVPLFEVDPLPFVPKDPRKLDQRCDEIINLQTAGLMRRLSGIKEVIWEETNIGLSGGLDSTLAFLITVNVYDKLGWDRNKINTTTMPGFGTTDRTKGNSIDLGKELKANLQIKPIDELARLLLKTVGHDPCLECLQCENSQARLRTVVLMTDRKGFVIGTGDLSELMLGWCTYNGDHMSMYNPNCGVPKTLVRFVVERIAKRNIFGDTASKIILDICDTPISPELLPGQVTEASIGKYDLNDFFIFHMLRNGFEPEKIHFLASLAFKGVYDGALIKERLIKFYIRVFTQQFKRNAVPDGSKIGSVALSPRGDWRAPSDAEGRLWIEAAKEIEV